MKYLFFDIECANCYHNKGKIFSFGYVLTDENFCVLEQSDLLINPKVQKWDFYVLKKILRYPMAQIIASPDFSIASQKIFSMLSDPQTIVFGFALSNDIRFLMDDSERYSLTLPAFDYYDVQSMLKIKENSKMPCSLEKAVEMYCETPIATLHRSDADAYNTMLLLQSLCKTMQSSPLKLANDLNYKPGNIQSFIENRIKKEALKKARAEKNKK